MAIQSDGEDVDCFLYRNCSGCQLFCLRSE